MTYTLAFYVGRGTMTDRLIRSATGCPASHVELLAPYEGPRRKTMTAISSSPRDGGVRVKEITFHPARWAFLNLEPWHQERPFDHARSLVGARYDWAAIAFTFALPLGRENPERWTCSELCAAALGLSRPHLISPGDLYLRVLELNAAYRIGRSQRRADPC